MQKDKLFLHFEKYVPLSDELKNSFEERLHFVTFKKGDLLHDAAYTCTKSYFNQKGLFRTYF